MLLLLTLLYAALLFFEQYLVGDGKRVERYRRSWVYRADTSLAQVLGACLPKRVAGSRNLRGWALRRLHILELVHHSTLAILPLWAGVLWVYLQH